MYLSARHFRACDSCCRSQTTTSQRPLHSCKRHDARTVGCRANEEEDAETARPNRWVALSDGTAVEFWTTITQHAALPAAVATGLQYSQTHSFLPVHLPMANAVPTVLWMMAPVVLLDLVLWNVAPYMKLDNVARHGLHKYHLNKAETHRNQCMRLPPIQHNFSRLALSMGRQFLLAMTMPVLLELLMEAQDLRPGCLPQLGGVPGLEGMDAGVVGSVVLLAGALWMASARVELAKLAVRSDARDRAAVQFMMSPDADTWPILGEPGVVQDRNHVAAAVSGFRFALLTACCSLVFLRSESIIASGWVSYVAANIEYRLVILNFYRLPARGRRRSY